MNGKWERYDPTWLVEIARQQVPDLPWLSAALASCTTCLRASDAYIYFVEALNPNEPGSEWQFETNVILEHETEGDLVLDILKDHRVGGVEFLAKL